MAQKRIQLKRKRMESQRIMMMTLDLMKRLKRWMKKEKRNWKT